MHLFLFQEPAARSVLLFSPTKQEPPSPEKIYNTNLPQDCRGSFYNNRSGLVVDQLIFSVPAVQLSDLLTNNLSRMLGSQFSHCTEMRLSARRRHIQ